MKRLPLALVLSAFFIFLALEVSIRQAVLMLVGVGMGAALAGARFGFVGTGQSGGLAFAGPVL